MEAIYLFLLLTIPLILGIVGIIGIGEIHETVQDWDTRRCDFDYMMSAFRYKPADDPRSIGEFAADNLTYCVSTKATKYLETIFGALFEVLRIQMNAADIMGQVLKILRTQMNKIWQPFSLLMTKFFNKFKQIGGVASRIFQQLFMSMKKAAATATGSIFVALSIQATILNTIDLLIKVLVIFMYILMALVFIFFLPILPLLVIVIITVAGVERAMPGSTGPMGEVFCFHKDTNVIMKNGDEQHISTLKPGDILHEDILVQAVIEVPDEELYDLDGVLVSGYHCLYEGGEVIYVKDHPRAKKSEKREPSLWTLITDKREIPVMGSRGFLRFLDWDEIPDSREAEEAWEKVAAEMLNGKEFKSDFIPTSPPCLDACLKAWVYQGGWRDISKIKVGDWIYGRGKWTKVVGKCQRIVHTATGTDGNRFSDGNWILSANGKWTHPSEKSHEVEWLGYQLITDSGCFRIQMNDGEERLVRDFTEIGSDNILDSHTRVEFLLEEKH
jgi:hypothetical protein